MYISAEIAEKIKLIAKQKNISIKKMLLDIGLGTNTMSNMKTSFPKTDSLAKIADYLDCSMDYLLDREKINEYYESKEDSKLIGLYQSLNLEGKYRVLEYLELMSSQDKYKKDNYNENIATFI